MRLPLGTSPMPWTSLRPAAIQREAQSSGLRPQSWTPCPTSSLRGRAQDLAGTPKDGCTKAAEKAPEEAPEDTPRAVDKLLLLQGACISEWCNVGMGFGFLSLTAHAGVTINPPDGGLLETEGV